jgi:glycosyltransferase involved in cell wall biosynthesis
VSESKQAPISACLIVRNEIANIEACLQSIRPFVKEIVVVDTGSTDGTQEIVKRYADVFEEFRECNDENDRIQDFSLARQRSFDLATQPWAMWLDGDDILEGADKLAEIVAAHDSLPRACVMWNYDYDHDGAGNITMRFIRERLVKPPRDFKWISPVHETLVPQHVDTPKILIPDGIKNVHRRRDIAKTVESGRNLRILQTYYNKVGDADVRALYYLGLELGWTGNPEQSIDMHKKYVEKSGWEDEKYLAILEICRHYQGMAKWDEAIDWALKAILVRETWGEAYYSLSKACYFRAQQTNDRRDWERAVNFARKYLASPPTETVLFINPMERKVEVHRYLVMACMQIGDPAGALSSCEEILKTLPGDENSLFNAKVAKERLWKEQAKLLGQQLHALGPLSDQALQLFNAAIDGKFRSRPADTAAQVAASAPSAAIDMKRHSGLDIVLYIGPSAERWTPDTIAATGIGGSERMAWEMSRRLARLGNRVRVYGDCEQRGNFEGVEWFNHLDYHHLACDVLITSRRPIAVEDQFQVQAKLKLCWAHDVHCGTELTQQRAHKLDRALCLSEWHRQFFLQTYDFVPAEQVIKTRNGIDLSLYAEPETRNPHRMFYSSSPDRGLFVALDVMPEIRRRVPDAELHIYYGFDVWERFAPPEQKQQIAFLKGLIEERKADGVVHHGRVSPPELAREQMRSGVWAYPTWFTETSCITAMEAQAAGCRIVTSPIAALNETVGNRGTMIDGYWLSPEYKAQFADACVAAMLKPGDEDREELRRYARENFDLDLLARDWHLMMTKLVRAVSQNPVVPYRTTYQRAA